MSVGTIRLEDYRTKAIEGARRAAAELERRGVKVVITGSLARGSFGRGSDVDFVVLECPRHLKYAIEAVVEDELVGIPFDVVYRDEIPAAKLRRFMDGAVSASNLR
jgi:predicted nucleotidyltransferase